MLALALGLFANSSISAADPSYDSQEAQFLSLINSYRESNGRSDLQSQQDLDEASDWFATDMATQNYYGGDQYCYDNFHAPPHCDSLGRNPSQRAQAFGYPGNVGENIAAGFGSAQAVFEAWKASSGHNANMLNSSYKSIGIGWACNQQAYYGCYWVTDFGFYTGPGSPPGPGSTPAPTESPQPTLSPPPAPTNSPSPSPTAAPTPTPVSTHPKWDDVDCDGDVTAADAVEVLRGGAGIFQRRAGCPSVGDTVLVFGKFRTWGDTDCSTTVEVVDSIKLLEYLGGLPIGPVAPGCPAAGTLF